MTTSYMPPKHALDAVTHANPDPYYDGLLARQGLHFDAGLGLWIAAGADDVMAVMRHPECRVRPMAEPVPAAIAGGAAGQVFGALVRMNDGERHAQPKLALQRALARQPEEERSGGEDVAALVQAVSRLDPPIQNTRRFVANDGEIGGVPVLAGQSEAAMLRTLSWVYRRSPNARIPVFS